MESSKPEIERIVLMLGMGIVILAMLCHFFSPIARTLDKQLDLQITVLTDPPVIIRYHPSSLTADIIQLPENAQDHRSISGLEKTSQWYIIPPGQEQWTESGRRLSVWNEIKEWIKNWRTDPKLILKYAVFLWKLHSKELTNISLYDLILLALEVPHLDVSDFYIVTQSAIPGTIGKPQSARHPEISGSGSQSRIRRFIRNGQSMPSIVLGSNRARAVTGPVRSHRAVLHPTERYQERAVRSKITAEVLNASGRRRLAHKVRKFLISNGVDVVDFRNYKQLEADTRIIDRSGNISASEEIRSLLGLESIEIHSEPDKTRLADVTVIVGKDFSFPQN